MPHHQSEAAVYLFACPCLSVCSMPRAQKRCILELRLLYNTNKKPHAERQTHHSAWPCRQQKWPKRPGHQETYIGNISKTKWDRAMVTTKRE